MAPAKTPKPIIDKIAAQVIAAAKDPAIVEKLARLGLEPDGNTPEEFMAQIKREQAQFDAAIEAAAAGKNFEIEAQRFGTALQEFTDRHASAHRIPGWVASPISAALMPASATAAPGLAPQAASCGPRRRTVFSPATCL